MGSISSFKDFIDWTLDTQARSKLMLFRGQPVKGNLLPNIARTNRSYNSEQLEKTVLNKFKVMGTSLLKGVGDSDLDLMVVAQHFGLKTRLLDWTTNPLVALYFACSDERNGDSYVYSLAAESMVTGDVFGNDPFSLTRTQFFQPPMNNPRVIAQQGWFSLHRYVGEKKGIDKSIGLSDPTKPKKVQGFVPLEKNKDTKDYLDQVKVVGASKSELLSALAGHGVASHTLFPDLSGLTQYLNESHLLNEIPRS